MGGCRCTFRGCPNNSANSPGMHFFHYPFKCPERFQLWVKYANTKSFLNIPENKARNKVVCETHFRDECFMNYKKERLVQFAIPTLVRLPNGMVLDFQQSDIPKPKLLEPTKSKHLIRPASISGSPAENSSTAAGSTSSSNEEEFVIEAIEEYTLPQQQKRTRDSMDDTDVSAASNPKVLKPSPRILNSGVRHYSASKKSHTPPRIITIKTIPTPTRFPTELLPAADASCEEISIEPVEEHIAEVACVDLPYECEETEEPEPPTEIPIHIANVSKAIFDETVAEYELKLQELKQKLAEKEAAEKAKSTQVETVSTSRPPAVCSNTGTLTKVQLFNGMKKYLSPSMAALVRMEMFGGPERQWKTDEKEVSMDLLKLGETVFNYFRDEWRFRLPPKRDVQQWLSTSDNIEDEEDI